jgi:cell division protein FtsQ
MRLLNWFTKKEDASQKRGEPLKRVIPVWRGYGSLVAVFVFVIVGIGSAGVWSWKNGTFTSAIDQTKWSLIAFSGTLGFTAEDVLVVGRSQTAKNDLLRAVRLARGAPILAYDLTKARQRIEKLPWITSAIVERMLPNTILLSVVERHPLALWQRKGNFELIDQMGKIISGQSIEKFSDLLVVVGNDAPENTSALLGILETQPQLMNLTTSAVRVGGRRWNIQLKGEIDIRLPAERARDAWSRLAEYERRYGILDRNVKMLDLRLPDRVIVQKNPSGSEVKLRSGRKT